jgi:hypothetical protein
MVAVIAYYLKSLLSEQKQTRKEVTDILSLQAADQVKMTTIAQQIIELKQADDRLATQMTDAITRLVRLEERAHVNRSVK